VIIATDAPLDLAAFEAIEAKDGIAHLARRVLDEREVDAILARGELVTLTDQYAPVDQMLAPVFRGQAVDSQE
jgi:hypothetical protein